VEADLRELQVRAEVPRAEHRGLVALENPAALARLG
jgi:hypothetical protein